MIQIIRGLFINMTIITSLVMFANMLMHEKYLSQTKLNIIRNGILAGIFGSLLMLFSVPIYDHVMIDFRFIPVILMALYVAPLAAMEAAIVIGTFRIVYFGINEASVLACISIIITGVICSLIGRTHFQIRTKWLLSGALVSMIMLFSVYLLISDLDNKYYILMVYLIGMIAVSTIMFYFTEFIGRFNRKIEIFKDEAEKDYLTGLKNPRQFDKTFKSHLESISSEQRSIALLYIDIDHFKNINDGYGHESGDLVLREIGKILTKVARDKDVVSRKGGEEFTMLLADCKLAQAEMVAERIRNAIERNEFKLPNNQDIHISVSIGVAALPETTSDESKLLELADKALYRAKQSGRNKVVIAGYNG